MATTKKSSRQQTKKEPATEYKLPEREWERATEMLKLFVATGWLKNLRSSSIMLVAEPGSGKTELLDRFRVNSYLDFASDLTVRGLFKILRSAQKGATTHIVATEFQKYLMRKASTADNMLGTLGQALEEGVGQVYIGDKMEDFGFAKVGLIGAITEDTLAEKRRVLQQTGFTSRVAIIRWGMSFDELQDVMGKIGSGDLSDLNPVELRRPDKPVDVEMSPVYSEHVRKYVSRSFRDHSPLRVFQRFRALTMASALLEGRKAVTPYDIAKVFAFHPYWELMEK